MKRKDRERLDRNIKRMNKRARKDEKREGEREPQSIGAYIKALNGLFMHDEKVIFNTLVDERILELLGEMMEDLPEDDWDTVIRKAVNQTRITQRDTACGELRSLIDG